MDYRVKIYEDWDSFDSVKIYVYAYDADYKSYYITVKDGILIMNPREEGETAKEPFLTLLKRYQSDKFLQALTEGLRQAGFVVEADNNRRISAEALNKEKDEQITWLRKQIERR